MRSPRPAARIIAVNGMVFVGSGYPGFQNGDSGNVMRVNVEARSVVGTPVSIPAPRSAHTRSSVARLPVALLA